MGVKFKMEFANVQNEICVVNFLFADYNDDPITIYGGARPFVLGEFNQDDDMFKPIRPQQATMEILASASGIDMEDFLTDNDDDIVVRFDFGNDLGYWYGYLSQEDIQETWVATNHILILRADDGFGRLREVPLSDNGTRLAGHFTPLQLIQYAAQDSAITFLRSRIISNLFHASMSTASNTTGLDQCTIDVRTFESSPTVFEDGYTVIEKINKSFSQTLFQWKGEWFILRVEELMIPSTDNLVGFQLNRPLIGQRASITGRFDVEVGVNESVKPIVPEIIKRTKKPSKNTDVRFDWEQYQQIICNESFKYGEFLSTSTVDNVIIDVYSVSDWTHRKGTTSNNQASTKEFVRIEEYADRYEDDYIKIEVEDGSTNSWIQSCEVPVFEDDIVEIQFQQKWQQLAGGAIGQEEATSLLLLYAFDGTWFSLEEGGRWLSSNPTTDNVAFIGRPVTDSDDEDWATVSVTSERIPKRGYMVVFLYVQNSIGNTAKYFKDLNFGVTPGINARRRRSIKGDYDRYTIQNNVAKNFQDQVYLDDSFYNYKGAIYEIDGETLTGDQWFRRRYNTERYTYKRHHALANWFMNRSYKTILESNFFGLRWDGEPIGLINTIKFVDDAPKKVFWITNMREIDFMNCTWSATLIEVFDELVEDNEPTDQDVHTFDFYYE